MSAIKELLRDFRFLAVFMLVFYYFNEGFEFISIKLEVFKVVYMIMLVAYLALVATNVLLVFCKKRKTESNIEQK